MLNFNYSAPVAQLDRASGYEPEGREFESLRAHHYFRHVFRLRPAIGIHSNFQFQAAKLASVSASTTTPRSISSGEAYSSGRWLYPFLHGINSMATGAMRDIKSES